MSNTNKSFSLTLFIFGILFSVIGYLTIDKLTTINNSLTALGADLKEVRCENNSQNQRIQHIEDFINFKPFNYFQNEDSTILSGR